MTVCCKLWREFLHPPQLTHTLTLRRSCPARLSEDNAKRMQQLDETDDDERRGRPVGQIKAEYSEAQWHENRVDTHVALPYQRRDPAMYELDRQPYDEIDDHNRHQMNAWVLHSDTPINRLRH